MDYKKTSLFQFQTYDDLISESYHTGYGNRIQIQNAMLYILFIFFMMQKNSFII